MPLPPPDIKRFVSTVVVGCPEITSVWSMDHAADEPPPIAAQYELLAFADKATLARWAWRQISPHESYYDESRWAQHGSVVRVRRKALLLWQAALVALQ